MEKITAKKTIILYILDILEKGTSFENPTTITSITKVLHSLGIECERRTVSRNINYLIDYGKPIIKLQGGKVYYSKKGETKI